MNIQEEIKSIHKGFYSETSGNDGSQLDTFIITRRSLSDVIELESNLIAIKELESRINELKKAKRNNMITSDVMYRFDRRVRHLEQQITKLRSKS